METFQPTLSPLAEEQEELYDNSSFYYGLKILLIIGLFGCALLAQQLHKNNSRQIKINTQGIPAPLNNDHSNASLCLAGGPKLVSLKISAGSFNRKFDPNQTVYKANLDYQTHIISFIPEVKDQNTIITINGIEVSSGHASAPIKVNDYAYNKAVKIIVSKKGSNVREIYTVALYQSIPMIQLAGDNLKPVLEGQTYNCQINVTGGSAPYTFTLEKDNSLPSFFSLSADGKITGTATKAGTFKFTTKVTDSNGYGAMRTFAITVTHK